MSPPTEPFVPKIASQELMKEARMPVQWRDNCSALLIPLNICRHDTLSLPWKCKPERHEYEKCQYEDYMDRMKRLSEKKTYDRENA